MTLQGILEGSFKGSRGVVVKIMVLVLGTLNDRCRIIIGIQKGAIILTTTHKGSCKGHCRLILATVTLFAIPGLRRVTLRVQENQKIALLTVRRMEPLSDKTPV